MSATTSSKDGPLRNRFSAPPENYSRWHAGVSTFFLALALALSPPSRSQTSNASTNAARDFVGTYKEQSTERRIRVLEKDGRLICESADGLSLVILHLVQNSPGDVFQIEEATTRQQVKFVRDSSGNVGGLNFGGSAFVRLPSKNPEPAAPSSTPSEPLRSPAPFPGSPPPRLPRDVLNRTGDFANQKETDVVLVLERAGHLILRDSAGAEHPVSPLTFTRKDDQTSYTYASNDTDPWVFAFEQYKSEPVWQLFTQLGPYHRLPYSVPIGSPNVVRVKPARPLAQIRSEALTATPPIEKGPFRKSDLVELASLDRSIRLDIRYATTDDFLGVPVYTQARAFLQRPAAEALLRAVRKLEPLGYGLRIHDGYRPWYVTKIFWDATPADGKIFVADPAQGSRHNRGCAVDLTLFDLKTGEPVEMTGLYDEMSPRSFPDYPGGTTLQRWHRDLLRWAMESEGFTVFDSEWWHFDYKDWREYAIGNVPFEKLEVPHN
jgi:D-alanyl-D-alanine dipeptidase